MWIDIYRGEEAHLAVLLPQHKAPSTLPHAIASRFKSLTYVGSGDISCNQTWIGLNQVDAAERIAEEGFYLFVGDIQGKAAIETLLQSLR